MKKVPRVKCYWWNPVPNFGDQLAPLLFEHFAGLPAEWDTISRSVVASVGSILEHLPPLWDGHIIGSGKLFETSRLFMSPKKATIWAIRGPLSARSVPPGDFALGDPGLLADELVGLQEKFFDVGIVPHWRDTELVKKIHNPSALFIDATWDPLTVLRMIGSCRQIVTSSLHGAIVADAFGIPRRIELCRALEREGGDFKFRDYSASIKMPFEPGKLQQANRVHVEDRKYELYDAYRELGKALR